jgi:6-methylpretetramide 4-monooxygenase
MAADTEVVIVGGGPAGLTLALLLLRSGHQVTVIERARSFQRDFRGEILQPGGMTLLDELQVLGPARERGGYPHSRFMLFERERVLMDIDYQELPEPHNFLLSIPQRHLLEELLIACRTHCGFSYLEGRSLSGLLKEGDRITGVVHGTGQDAAGVRARCVIGADGRYSKTRKLAGIGYSRKEVFAHDVLWFKIPVAAEPEHTIQIHRGEANPLLIYSSYPDAIQVGWTLPHKGYREVAAKGVDYVKNEIMRVAPARYVESMDNTVRELTDLTLLDVFSGTADTWVRDGLVLIGDSAHTHSPIGAQGINLAIQDAVELHPVLVGALRAGNTSRECLKAFEETRRPDIDAVIKVQVRQGKAMLSKGPADAIRPAVMKLLAHTPIYGKVLRQIAFGRRPIRLRSDLFSA